MRKKNLVTALLVASMLACTIGVTSTPAEAKSKIKLSSKSISLSGGAAKTITLKGTKKKVKWSVVSGKKNIKLKNKKKTSVKIVGVKRGSAKVQAKLGKKKYTCKVTVKTTTPSKTITITKADTQTAKTVHEALNTGKAVNLKVKGSKSSASKLMTQVSKLVGEYNKFDVVPQYSSSSSESEDSGYRIYSLSATETQTYKYGLLLVKDIVSGTKQRLADYDAKKTASVQSTEANVRKNYAVGTSNYAEIFSEVTGVPYNEDFVINGTKTYSSQYNYMDGQVAKSKQATLYYDSRIKLDESWSLPQDYYYMTFNVNGKQAVLTSEETWYLDHTKYNDDSDLVKPESYFMYYYEMETGDEFKINFSDVTFHYEPLTVDTSGIATEIEKRVKADVELNSGYHADAYVPRTKQTIETTEFYKLSQAEQQYWISRAFDSNSEWTYYDAKSASGVGLQGIKAMLNNNWHGKCVYYARMEVTMYKLFGISEKDYCCISCKECDHTWSAVRVVNSKGQTAWLCNNYGIGDVGYTNEPRHFHNGTSNYTLIPNFVFPE